MRALDKKTVTSELGNLESLVLFFYYLAKMVIFSELKKPKKKSTQDKP